jgi:hypothetical protein
MTDKVNITTRWTNIEPTKSFVFWACVATAVLTIFVGFKWGGWVTGGGAREMAESYAIEARADLAVASCVERFNHGPDSGARLAALRKTDSWMRGSYMDKAGWATPVGAGEPVQLAGERCAEKLLSSGSPTARMTN